MTDNNEYDEYTKNLIEAIITAADDSSVTFDVLKSKTPNNFLPETFDGSFPQFLMNIGFTTPDGLTLDQSPNKYFYNSIDENKWPTRDNWMNELKEKLTKNILKELTIFDIRWIIDERGKKFISQFLIYIAFELLQYSKNKYWNNCLVKTINTNPDNKNLKPLEVVEGQPECKLKNPKEYHPIYNGRLFIEDLFSRINKYFETAQKKLNEETSGKKSSVVPEEFLVPKENLKNAKEIIKKIKIKLAHALSRYKPASSSNIQYLNAAFKKQDLLDLMKRSEHNDSHNFQLNKLMNTLGNKPIGSETQSPLHEGGRKTRRRRNIRVKSRHYR